LIYTTKKIKRVFSDDQFKLQELQTLFRCFLVCFAMVQVMMSLWSLFIGSLGSYSHWRVTNGVMPCVLGPTSFYLKLWANILIKDELQNVVVFLMIFIWVHHDIHLGSSCMNEHMNFWAITKVWVFHIHQKVTFPDWPRDWCRRDKVDSASSCPCYEGLCGLCIVPTLMRVYL